MPKFVLEPVFAATSSISVPLVFHNTKRVDRFAYKQEVGTAAVPIAYIENEEFDSRSNLQIADRSYSVPLNAPKSLEIGDSWAAVTGGSYTSVYKDVLVTNQTFIDGNGKTLPLFWKHALPEDVVECTLTSVTRGNQIVVDTGYAIDTEQRAVFTNYQNYFNADTGAYKLWYVTWTLSTGETGGELLNPVSAAHEATWQDIDPATGGLTTDYPCYSKAATASGYSYYFNVYDTWYIKPLERSLIRVAPPRGVVTTDPWFPRIKDGHIVANVNSSVRKYSVPEYLTQPFAPHYPYRFSTSNTLLWVNDNVVAATEGSLGISPDDGRHLTIFVYDTDETLFAVYTTDSSLGATRYSDTDIFYQSDRITSWDNHGGYVELADVLKPGWTYEANYFYAADDYEYPNVDLNPMNNKKMYDHLYVIYCIPDVGSTDRAIHHLLVNRDGDIVDCSQGDDSVVYPNLALLNASGTYNSGTIIGSKYMSSVAANTFLSDYTAGYPNTYGYMVLAEIALKDRGLLENQLAIDVGRDGHAIRPSVFADAIQRNHRILQSQVGLGENGQEVPENGVMVIRAPVTLLEDYGGTFTETAAEQYLQRHRQAGNYTVIEWEYPWSELTVDSTTATQVDLTYTWEGNPNYSYKIYSRGNPTAAWTLINTDTTPAGPGPLTWSDTGLTTDDIWYYCVRIDDGTYEYPHKYSISTRVR